MATQPKYSQYIDQPDFRHGTPERLGVLLVNLGTPDAPTAKAVERFLADFLWDPRVTELPRFLWWLILHGIILRVRPRRTAKAYQAMWSAEGSPLLVESKKIAAAVQPVLDRLLPGRAVVGLAMTYGNPSIPAALAEMRKANVRRLLVVPLYPQYSATTTAAIFDRVTSELQRWRWLPEVRFVNQYHDDAAYIGALIASIEEHRRKHGSLGHLVMSFHGLPKRYLLHGDPYHCHCFKTARLLAEGLGLTPSQWSLAFQSRVGYEEWLRPYTDEHLLALARAGEKHVTVICPGFAADCLETLEEIAIGDREAYLAAGGERFDYVPALNDRTDHIAMLGNLVARHVSGWPEAGAQPAADEQAETAAATSQRARAAGAAH